MHPPPVHRVQELIHVNIHHRLSEHFRIRSKPGTSKELVPRSLITAQAHRYRHRRPAGTAAQSPDIRPARVNLFPRARSRIRPRRHVPHHLHDPRRLQGLPLLFTELFARRPHLQHDAREDVRDAVLAGFGVRGAGLVVVAQRLPRPVGVAVAGPPLEPVEDVHVREGGDVAVDVPEKALGQRGGPEFCLALEHAQRVRDGGAALGVCLRCR